MSLYIQFFKIGGENHGKSITVQYLARWFARGLQTSCDVFKIVESVPLCTACMIYTYVYIYLHIYMYIHTNICTRLVIDLDICLLTFRHARLNKCEIVENPRHMVLRNTTDWQEKLSLEDVISLDEIFLKLNPQRLWKPLGLGDVW